MLTLYAGLINWLVTTIFVEAKLFAPWREWVVREASVIRARDEIHHVGNKHAYLWPEDTTEEEANAATVFLHGPWAKAAQLITCHLCTRVWVGFAQALYLGGPLGGWAATVANGLLYAAIGHLIFELRSRVALVLPTEQP